MSATYNPTEVERLIAEARAEISRRRTAPRCDSCGGLIMHRSEHWLAAMADQLEAARAEIERMRTLTLSGSAQRRLVRHLMIGHPLPWRLELDWTVEVTDANNSIVIKCMHVDEANEIIALASVIAADDSAARGEFERLFAYPVP